LGTGTPGKTYAPDPGKAVKRTDRGGRWGTKKTKQVVEKKKKPSSEKHFEGFIKKEGEQPELSGVGF